MSALRTLELERTGPGRSRRAVEVDLGLVIATLAFFALITLALFGGRLAPHEPIYFVVEHGKDLRPFDPGIVFPFGSDVLGRDILSLVLAGAGTTLAIVLIGGVARVGAGIVLAAAGALWRPLRLVTETAAEFVSAIPATLVALVVVKILVKADTTILVFVGALLLIGWAGPYRVVRAEMDRLAHAPFTVGARVLGVSSWRLFWRHQLPHLVPVLVINLAQQVVASLVLVAELGVLGTFVGTTRFISIEESLSRVVTGPPTSAFIADPPEWGGLLASARTVEILWTTRWLIFVPGVAFVGTATAIALIGIGVSRRYAGRDMTDDVRGPGVAMLALGVAALVLVSTLLPERYADARTWAADARAASVDASVAPADAFAAAGLTPLTSGYALTREATGVLQTAGASVTIGTSTATERWPRDTTSAVFGGEVRSFVSAGTGGGQVDAPLVFVGRGIAPKPTTTVFRPRIGLQLPDLDSLLKAYPDDYASVDVRGKVVLLVRFKGFRHETFDNSKNPPQIKTRQTVGGYPQEDAIADAIKRGAAAVLFVDNELPSQVDGAGEAGSFGPPSPYSRVERSEPAIDTAGVPVVVLSAGAAATLTGEFGLDLGPLQSFDDYGRFDDTKSLARDLGVNARVSVPLTRQLTRSTTIAGEIAGADPQKPRILVWTVRQPSGTDDGPTHVLASVARALGPRQVPFIFVSFDPTGDARANKAQVIEALGDRPIGLVVVLLDVKGDALQFTTPNGDLIPAFDLYADRAGARHVITRGSVGSAALGEVAPLQNVRTILVQGRGDQGDLRADAQALLGYIAGRAALGAEEFAR